MFPLTTSIVEGGKKEESSPPSYWSPLFLLDQLRGIHTLCKSQNETTAKLSLLLILLYHCSLRPAVNASIWPLKAIFFFILFQEGLLTTGNMDCCPGSIKGMSFLSRCPSKATLASKSPLDGSKLAVLCKVPACIPVCNDSWPCPLSPHHGTLKNKRHNSHGPDSHLIGI